MLDDIPKFLGKSRYTEKNTWIRTAYAGVQIRFESERESHASSRTFLVCIDSDKYPGVRISQL